MGKTYDTRRLALVVHEAEAKSQSRLSAMRLVSLTLRLMERWRGLVDDNDDAMIVMAVALINTENLTKADLIQGGIASLEEAASPQQLRKCNVRSVSLATGLNRETTRRKVSALVEQGFLAKDAKGHVYLHPQLPIREEMVRVVRSQLDTFAKTADDMVRDGIIKICDR